MGLGEIPPRGAFKSARLTLNGVEFMAVERAMPYPFTVTPSIPFFVDWESEAELDSAYGALANRVEALSALGTYGVNERFGWIRDRYCVNWQLTLSRRTARSRERPTGALVRR